MNFTQARKAHSVVERAARRDLRSAMDLWSALSLVGTPPEDSYAEAAVEICPTEHVSLLATCPVAVAFAFAKHWDVLALYESKDDPSASRMSDLTPFQRRELARGAWDKFKEKAKRTEDMALGFGWDMQDAWSVLKDVPLSPASMETVMAVGRLAGRMYAALRGAMANRVHGLPEEVYSVTTGGDFSRLLAQETMLFGDPDREASALLRVIERQAMMYAVRGRGKQSKGPFVIALDESGSMHEQRRNWSKAAAVALARVAAEENRPVSVVHYSTSCVSAPLDPKSPASVLRMIRHFLEGGTDIGLAISNCTEQVVALADKGVPGADVVLVTDGVDEDQPRQKAALAELGKTGARLWLVAIEREVLPGNPLRDAAAHYVLIGANADEKAAVALSGAA